MTSTLRVHPPLQTWSVEENTPKTQSNAEQLGRRASGPGFSEGLLSLVPVAKASASIFSYKYFLRNSGFRLAISRPQKCYFNYSPVALSGTCAKPLSEFWLKEQRRLIMKTFEQLTAMKQKLSCCRSLAVLSQGEYLGYKCCNRMVLIPCGSNEVTYNTTSRGADGFAVVLAIGRSSYTLIHLPQLGLGALAAPSACKMSVSVKVGLLSGRAATVKVGLHEHVGKIQHGAQTALGVGKGRLVDASGNVLDGHLPIKDAWLSNGDSLTLHKLLVVLLPPFLAMDPS